MKVIKLDSEQWGNGKYKITNELGNTIGLVAMMETGEWGVYLYRIVSYSDEGKTTSINFYYKRFSGSSKALDYVMDNYHKLLDEYKNTNKKIIYQYQDLYGPKCDYYANDLKPIIPKNETYEQFSLWEV